MQFSDQNATTDSENAEPEYNSWLYFRGSTFILHSEISVQISAILNKKTFLKLSVNLNSEICTYYRNWSMRGNKQKQHYI